MRIKIKNNELKIPIILNLILVFILYADYYLPTHNVVEEKFVSFYNVIKSSPRIKGGGGKEVKYILECSNGNLYHLYTFPENKSKIQAGQKLYISKTPLLSKVKSLKLDPKSEEASISLLSNKIITFLFFLATLITIANFFFKNTALDFFLAFSSAYIYLLTASYLFYL